MNKELQNRLIISLIILASIIAMLTVYTGGKDKGRVEACESMCGGEARWILESQGHCACIVIDHIAAPSIQ
tara:strand:- start:854 stop:1066 length:213 start_codon:yes stop_codon:yes gene_type:complete